MIYSRDLHTICKGKQQHGNGYYTIKCDGVLGTI